MKAVLISIRPEWCEKIVSGDKTIEIRKTVPKLATPFKCYIYCTYGQGLIEYHDPDYPNMLLGLNVSKNATWGNCCNGKVIGEFVCDHVLYWQHHWQPTVTHICDMSEMSCVTVGELRKYAGENQRFYGWHISDLVIYDKPKALSEFYKVGTLNVSDWEYQRYDGSGDPSRSSYASYLFTRTMRKPPQSWCYVEG